MADAANSITSKQSKSKPGQWKIIAALVGVLVLLNLFSGGSEDSEDVAAGDTTAVGQARNQNASPGSAQREIHWPVVPLEFLLTHNPFRPGASRSLAAMTEPLVSAEFVSESQDGDMEVSAESNEVIGARGIVAGPVTKQETSLSARKVQMVFRSARGSAAMIGDKIYHEGDLISDYVITTIARDGVTLRPVDASELSP